MQALDLPMSTLSGSNPSALHHRHHVAPGWASYQEAAAYAAQKASGSVEQVYDYPDADGALGYVVARIRIDGGKTFRPFHLIAGRWHLGDPSGLLPLYRLQQTLTASVVVVCEGEKCVLRFESLRVVATTSSHGSRSAKKSDWSRLKGKKVLLAPDNDDAGRAYVADVHRILLADPSTQVFQLELPGLAEGEDVVDWAQKLTDAGLDDERIAAELDSLIKAAKPRPSLSITYSTYSTGQVGGSGVWPVPQPISSATSPTAFPIDTAFPPTCAPLRDFVRAVAEAYQVPVDLPSLLALAALGLAVSRTVEVAPQPNWREPLAIYVLILLRSGERKSAVFSKMINPIREWQTLKANGMASTIAAIENDIKINQEKLSRKRRDAAQGKQEEDGEGMDDLLRLAADLAAKKPVPPSLIATEATTEAIADLLVENNERGMLAAAEGDALDVMLGRYSLGRANFGLWLSGHAGDSIEIRRKGRPTLRLRRPTLTVALAIQPEAASELLASRAASGRGVLARFFFSLPQSKLGYREPQPPQIPTHLTDWYGGRLHQLLDRPVPNEPATLTLDAGAAALFLEFRQKLEVELRPEGRFFDHAAWGSKLAGAVARIAGILHCVSDPEGKTTVITEATMRAALAWAPYLEAHERHVVWLAGDDSTSSIAERILTWIRRHGHREFTANQCYNGVRGSLVREAKDIDSSLALLEELGWIRLKAAEQAHRSRGRPPSRQYEVNPATWPSDPRPAPHNTHNTQKSGSAPVPPASPPPASSDASGRLGNESSTTRREAA